MVSRDICDEICRVIFTYLARSFRLGGIIQVDDYTNWEGSRRATDEADWLQPYKRWLVNGSLVIDTGRPLT